MEHAIYKSVQSWCVSENFVAEKNGADFWKLGAKVGLCILHTENTACLCSITKINEFAKTPRILFKYAV